MSVILERERMEVSNDELVNNLALLEPIDDIGSTITWAKNRATPIHTTNERGRKLSASDVFREVKSKFMPFVGQTETGGREVFEVVPQLKDRKGGKIDPETRYAYDYAIQMLHLGAIKNAVRSGQIDEEIAQKLTGKAVGRSGEKIDPEDAQRDLSMRKYWPVSLPTVPDSSSDDNEDSHRRRVVGFSAAVPLITVAIEAYKKGYKKISNVAIGTTIVSLTLGACAPVSTPIAQEQTPVIVDSATEMAPAETSYGGSTLKGPIVEIGQVPQDVVNKAQLARAKSNVPLNALLGELGLKDKAGNIQSSIFAVSQNPENEAGIYFYTEEGPNAFPRLVPAGTGVEGSGFFAPMVYKIDGDHMYWGIGSPDKNGIYVLTPGNVVLFDFLRDQSGNTLSVRYIDPYSKETYTWGLDQLRPKFVEQLIGYKIPGSEPEATAVAEFIKPSQPIVFVENIDGVDLKVSPEANISEIFWMIAASNMVNHPEIDSRAIPFYELDQNIDPWAKVLAEHPEYAKGTPPGGIKWEGVDYSKMTNESASLEIRIAAAKEFLKQTGGKMFMNFLGGGEGMVDFNKPISFQYTEVNNVLELPQGYNLGKDKINDKIDIFAVGQISVNPDGGLSYHYFVTKEYANISKNTNGLTTEQFVAYKIANMVEAQADLGTDWPADGAHSKILTDKKLTTNPGLFIWGNGDEDYFRMKGFTKSFVVPSN